jgi:glycosyltransferase 2 family protein
MDRQGSPSNTPALRQRQRHVRLARTAAAYSLAALCLLWVFHDIHPLKLARSLTSISWRWAMLAIAFDILSYVFQGVRWRMLLRPLGNLSTMETTQVIYAGLFANEVLPMRFGELVRAFLASRRLSANFASIIPSMIVERLLDGVWLAIAIVAVALSVRLPKDILDAIDIFAMAVLVSIGLFVYLTLRDDKSSLERIENEADWKPARVLGWIAHRFTGGLRSIGLSRTLFLSLGVSLAMLVMQALAFWLVMHAYGLRLSFWSGVAVFLIVHLGSAIPSTPANIGPYQFFTVAGLTLFGVEKTLAAGFSVVVFVLLSVPLWIIGFFALSRSGTTLFAIQNQLRALRSQDISKQQRE